MTKPYVQISAINGRFALLKPLTPPPSDRRIARVFPTKTKATPDDDLVFFGYPRKGAIPEVDKVHVSV
ncbi:hypothetical protein FDZ73_19965, partial [bacterium]